MLNGAQVYAAESMPSYNRDIGGHFSNALPSVSYGAYADHHSQAWV